MGARRGAAAKKSLARQEIVSRKRQVADEKLKTSSAGRRALAGVFLLAASAICLVSMLTYDARDRAGAVARNAAGPAGHGLADAAFGALGVTGFVVPLCGLYAALVLFVGSKERRRWPQVLAALLLCASGSVLAELLLAPSRWAYAPGGALGGVLSAALTGVFSTVGTLIVVGAVCAAALIVGTQFAFLKLCSLGFHGAAAMSRAMRSRAAALWAAQRAAFQARREQVAKEKLEEAAFLAQLEADEDDLAQAERDAAEADAIAEEAVRLSRQPKKKEKKEEAVTEPPAQARTGAPGDPVWAAQLVPPPPASPGRRGRKALALPPGSPKIVAPPDPATAAAVTDPSIPASSLESVPIPRPETAPAAAPPPPPQPSAPEPAAARMPVIVEPKAPPKPTRRKEPEQFQFHGDRKSFTLPPLDVLECDKKERTALDKEAFLATAEKLRAKLLDFGIQGEVVEIRPGPVVTMYEFLPGPGIKVSKIASLADDLAMAMEAMRVRIVAPIPGKGVVGIEVPNRDRETVYLKEIAEQDAFNKSTSKLTMCLGKDIEGMPYVLDLAKAPHLLIAGTTGSGKSVAVNSMIMSILLKATPEEVRFIMVDPKMLELSVYEGIPHLLLPVVTDPKKAALALRWAVEEMERRYHLLSDAGVRNIAGYNKLVDSAGGDAKTLLRAQADKPKPPAQAVVEAKPAALPTPPAAPAAGGSGLKKRVLIVDVEEGESEDQARERAQAAAVGVEAPREPVEEIRAPVESAPEPAAEAVEAKGPAELAVAAPEPEPEPEPLRKLPYIMVIIDELADLMMVASREVETYIARLAQMARAAGIHLMVATQRPSTDVVTGVIKA
ncbi:MAG TPA: DNA translocase FtsK 4TM domain-containing protein, partial [Myxococcales bacterium]|nr:DNA translocase FtsK 4TM domain-containing protein [Myxococcales bacterium]